MVYATNDGSGRLPRVAPSLPPARTAPTPVAGDPTADLLEPVVGARRVAEVDLSPRPAPPTPSPASPTVANDASDWRLHAQQETRVTLSPEAVDGFVRAGSHREAMNALFGDRNSSLYISDHDERAIAYAAFMAELYNVAVPRGALDGSMELRASPPSIVAVPTADAVAELAARVEARQAMPGAARANYAALGGGALPEMSAACSFDPSLADACASVTAGGVAPDGYEYRLGAGETLAQVTVAANRTLISAISDEQGVPESAVVGAMAVVARAINESSTHEHGLGPGAAVLVASFAAPTAREMLEAFLQRPASEQERALRALALSSFVATGVLHQVASAPIGSSAQAAAALGRVDGEASGDLISTRAPDSSTRAVLERIRDGVNVPDRRPDPERSILAQAAQEPWEEAPEVSLLEHDRVDARGPTADARDARRAEQARLEDELSAIEDEVVEARLGHRRDVEEELVEQVIERLDGITT